MARRRQTYIFAAAKACEMSLLDSNSIDRQLAAAVIGSKYIVKAIVNSCDAGEKEQAASEKREKGREKGRVGKSCNWELSEVEASAS